MQKLNVIGTRLRELDLGARRLIAEALNAGRDAIVHLAITSEGLAVMGHAVVQHVARQIELGDWLAYDISSIADTGIVRARVVNDERTGAVVQIRVELWLAAFVEPVDESRPEVAERLDPALIVSDEIVN